MQVPPFVSSFSFCLSSTSLSVFPLYSCLLYSILCLPTSRGVKIIKFWPDSVKIIL